MIEHLDDLINQNYDKLMYKDLVNIKINCNYIIRTIDNHRTDNNFTQAAGGLLVELKNMRNFTDSVFGVIINPYSDIHLKVHHLYVKLAEIKTSITEEFLLDNISFYNKKQTFNKNIFLALRNGYGSNDKSVQDFMEVLTEGKDALNRYNKLLNSDKKMLSLQLKYLGKPKNELLFGKEGGLHHIYDINIRTFNEKKYYFHSWKVSSTNETSHSTIDYKDIFADEFKKILPEMYL